MILVISGMAEGNKIYEQLAVRGYDVCRLDIRQLLSGENKAGDLRGLFEGNQIRLLVDAANASEEASARIKELCCAQGIEYLKYIRQELVLPDNPLIFPVYSWEDAAETSAAMGDHLFLTTGSYNLELFLRHPALTGKRIIVRLLPNHKVIERVQAMGVPPKDIIAMQGPFTREINKAMFRMYHASVMVTKDSGKKGGTDTKISAALSLNIPVVIIKRPMIKEDDQIAYSPEQILSKAKEILNQS